MAPKFSKFLKGQPILVGDSTIPGVGLYPELEKLLPTIFREVRAFGCDFFDTVVQRLRHDEMSEIAAYGGFPVRYPHWKWGMEYEELQRGYELGMHKIYEMVVNTNPCYIYLLERNTLVDDVLVVAHALGHCDFFKNNVFFSQTSQNMMNELANHGTRIRKYMRRHGKERVSEFIDHVLRIQTLIDPAKAWNHKKVKNPVIKDEKKYRHPTRLKVGEGRDYMDDYINPKGWIDKQHSDIAREEAAEDVGIFNEPTKDIMKYMRDYAPLHPWQSDILAMIYEESMYFAPQRQTKALNEGWACLYGASLVCTSSGILKIKDVVESRLSCHVDDGVNNQPVVNFFKFTRPKIKVVTKRGYELTGSNNHRIWDENHEWRRLDEIKSGDKISLAFGNVWAEKFIEVEWKCPSQLSLGELCSAHKVSEKTFRRYLKGNYVSDRHVDLCLLVEGNLGDTTFGKRTTTCKKQIKVPSIVNEDLASFIGYMVGDGHISDKKRTLGLTTGDLEQSNEYVRLLDELFGLIGKERWDSSSKNGRWRISVTSKNLRDFLVYLGLKTGKSARIKDIPDCILRSPKKVMSAFLRSYFDSDGYAGPSGVILSTSSTDLAHQVQVILANYGILSTRKLNKDETWHVRVTGKSAKLFKDEIGFGLSRKQDKLDDYVNNRNWFCEESFVDEIVSIEDCGEGEVYDITVENSHRYAALGFMNHNSRVDYEIMAKRGFAALGQDDPSGGIIEYAAHKWGVLGGKYSMNPYKLGSCLFQDIEERWDKGQFGDDWDNCTNMRERKEWDKKLGLGHDKIFEVRKFYDDLTTIIEFFTPDFCEKYEFFDWQKQPDGTYVVQSTGAEGYKRIKKKLVNRYLNGGLPELHLVDPNHRGKGHMFIEHVYDGRPLYEPWVAAVMESLCFLWKNEVYISTKDPKTDQEIVYCCAEPDESLVEVKTREEYMK